MGQTALLVKVVGSRKNCEWIYRFGANPGTAVGRLPAALSGLGPGSALRSRPRVALSSAQAFSAYITGPWLVHSPVLGLGSSPCVGRRQLVPPCGPDCLSATGELIRRSYVRDGAVQPDRVVVGHELGNEPSSVFQAQRGLDANAPSFQGLVPPLHLAVALGIVERGSNVSHSTYADELLEVLGDELRPVVRDDSGPLAGKLLSSPLDDRLHLAFFHGLADLPVDDEPAVAVEDAAKEVERPADIDVGDIDVPVLMRPHRLLEALPLLGRRSPTGSQLAGCLEHAIDARGAHGHDVSVEHHVGQPPVSFQGIESVEGDDRGLLPILQPEITRNGGVVLVGSSQPPAPAVEFARCDRQPSDQEQHRKAGAPGPVSDEMDNQITGRLRNPPSVQSSPSSFFSLTCSSISSESTSCLRWSFCSRKAIFLSLPSLGRRERGSNAALPFSKNSFCRVRSQNAVMR